MQKLPFKKSAGLLDTCKSKDDKVFWLSYRNNENIQISVEIANTNHCVITSMCLLTFLVVKALRHWRQIRKAIKR
jgi:hypothetical protein